jgi:hypothetical protein
VRDKLKITGFGLNTGSGENDDLLSKAVRRVWDANRMAVRSGQIHKEALKNGDAFVIVWPNEKGEPVIYPNRAENTAVFYDDETPGRIRWAAKYWRNADKAVRLNLYYLDRIERYISDEKSAGFLPDAGRFRQFTDSLSPVVANPYGLVPVFHFANNADVGTFGTSELEAAIAIQDGLNKSVLDMLVAMEFSAYRQRWAAGIELEEDNVTGEIKAPFKAGIDHLWISTNPAASFGDFHTVDLEQFLKVKESFRIDMACVTETPLHYLQPSTKGFPSGESLRKAETRFIAKVHDRQTSFGQVWAEAMSFALLVSGQAGAGLVTHWEDPAAIGIRETLENILLKKKIGISAEQALLEAGCSDAEVRNAQRQNK